MNESSQQGNGARKVAASEEATAYAMNALLTAFLLADATPGEIMSRIEIIETLLDPMPAGTLRETLFNTIGVHRAMILDLDPSMGGRC